MVNEFRIAANATDWIRDADVQVDGHGDDGNQDSFVLF